MDTIKLTIHKDVNHYKTLFRIYALHPFNIVIYDTSLQISDVLFHRELDVPVYGVGKTDTVHMHHVSCQCYIDVTF